MSPDENIPPPAVAGNSLKQQIVGVEQTPNPAEAPNQESRVKALAETIVGWASISYAIGFFVIMCHMWRLGLPAPEPVDAVNIWIGAPVALILFLATLHSKKLSKVVQSRIKELQDEVATAKTQSIELAMKDVDLLDWLVLLMGKVLSFVTFGGLMVKVLARLLAWLKTKYQKKPSVEISPAVKQAIAKGLHFYLLYAAYNRFIAFISYAILLILSLCLYVDSYPKISQSFGGGKPVLVNLIVDTEKVPVDAPELCAMFDPVGVPSNEKARTTVRVDLVYSTKEAYYIRKSTNAIVTLKADAVTGIIW
jgi:hypothetical protein